MIQSAYLVIESDGFDITTHQFDTKEKALAFMDNAQRSDEDVLIRGGLTERNTIRKLQEVQVEVDLSKANEEFVTNFMKSELRENFDVEKMDETEIDAIAAKAFEIYQRGDGQTEYEALEEAYDAHVHEDDVNLMEYFKDTMLHDAHFVYWASVAGSGSAYQYELSEEDIRKISDKAKYLYDRDFGTPFECLDMAYGDTVKEYERQTEGKAREYETLDLTKTLRDETSDYEKMDPKDDPLDYMDVER